MDYRNNAYGIGQRRQPNDASSIAPIRGGSSIGGGGGISGSGIINDNFRGLQSMNFGRADSFNNGNNNFNYGNNNQRYADIEKKFTSNNFGRAPEKIGYSNFNANTNNNGNGNGNSNINNNQRFAPINNRGPENVTAAPNKIGYFDNNYRGQPQQQYPLQQQQQQSGYLGRSVEQRFSYNDNNPKPSISNYNSGSRSGVNQDNFTGKSTSVSKNINLNNRPINDVGYTDNSQRFYNDRNDTFRRSDNFNDDYPMQLSNNQPSSGANFKFNNNNNNNGRNEGFSRTNSSGNFGFENNGNFNRGSSTNNSFETNFNNKSNNQGYFNNQPNAGNDNNDGFNRQNYRGQNDDVPTATRALAAISETVSALMKNQSNWQVGFGQNNYGGPSNRNPNHRRNASPAGNKPQFSNQGKTFKPMNNYNSNSNNNYNNINNRGQPPIAARVSNNRIQNQQKPNLNNVVNNRNKPDQLHNRNVNNKVTNNVNINKNTNNNKQQPKNQSAAKNVNGSKTTKAAVAPKINSPAQNTQSINANKPEMKKEVIKKPEVKQETTDAKAKPITAVKRKGDAPARPVTKADVKRRKLAIKRGFLLGGFKLPYINSNKTTLPQQDDKSYAVMFFEQTPNYSTSGEELDDEDSAVNIEESDSDGKNAGRMLVKRIRKRLHYEWTQMEEAKKYENWHTWWTDYKWCESAIKEELDKFGSINLRDCFIPDLPRLSTEEVVDVIVKSGQFALEKNSDNYFHNMKSIFTLMNSTFLENLKMPNTEKVQDMIRAVPNNFWTYKMRSMVYLWTQYLKISKTSSPSSDTGAKELQAIARDWKNPVFHWVTKQAFDEVKAISEVEWPEHKQLYADIVSADST